jgi:HEAT repeat protein
MTRKRGEQSRARLKAALDDPKPSARLQAALTAGTHPDPAYVDVLVARCATEPDFFVRDMLTWALTRHDPSTTAERLLRELRSAIPQARSQALHTLSKIGDPRTWDAITTELLRDADDEVARTAWRTAAAVVPSHRATDLAERLSTQFNRGGPLVQLSLSRAFATLGAAAAAVVERAKTDLDPGVRAHAIATERITLDPDEDFGAAIAEARRTVALLGAPLVEVSEC